MLRRLIGEDVELVHRPRPGLRPVKADPGQIEQVIMNLAVNARDAMPTGASSPSKRATSSWTRPTPRLHPEVTPGRYVLLAVSDTGSAWTQETKARIFEPFFTTKEVGQGHGPGPGDGLRDRQAERRLHLGLQRAGAGHRLQDLFPRSMAGEGLRQRRSFIGVKPLARGAETILLVEDEDAVRSMVRERTPAVRVHRAGGAEGE